MWALDTELPKLEYSDPVRQLADDDLISHELVRSFASILLSAYAICAARCAISAFWQQRMRRAR
jgi:hypothetical protein